MKAKAKMAKRSASGHRVGKLGVEFPSLDEHVSHFFVYLTHNGTKVPYEIDIDEFAMALKAPGTYNVFTCIVGGAFCTTLNPTQVDHKKDLITFHIYNLGQKESTLTFKRKDGLAVLEKIKVHMFQNKIVEQIANRKIEALIEDKIKMMEELRHKNKLIKEYRVALIGTASVTLYLVMKVFLSLGSK